MTPKFKIGDWLKYRDVPTIHMFVVAVNTQKLYLGIEITYSVRLVSTNGMSVELTAVDECEVEAGTPPQAASKWQVTTYIPDVKSTVPEKPKPEAQPKDEAHTLDTTYKDDKPDTPPEPNVIWVNVHLDMMVAHKTKADAVSLANLGGVIRRAVRYKEWPE